MDLSLFETLEAPQLRSYLEFLLISVRPTGPPSRRLLLPVAVYFRVIEAAKSLFRIFLVGRGRMTGIVIDPGHPPVGRRRERYTEWSIGRGVLILRR
jgi:hypothetical protein